MLAWLVVSSTGPVHAQGAAGGGERSGGLTGMLSAPLPGTRARGDEDAARALETALAGFEDIVSAHAVVVTDDCAFSETSRRAALRLSLSGAPPSQAWVESIAHYALQVLPGVEPTDLTIIDTGGNPLFSGGVAAELAQPAAAAPLVSPPADSERMVWLLAAAAVGAALVFALVMLRRRNGRQQEPPSTPPEPFDFISDLSDEDVAGLLQGEREAVVAAVIHLAPGGESERLRRVAGSRELPALRRKPPADVAAALERALREKLVRR